jgi:hypothetical protein
LLYGSDLAPIRELKLEPFGPTEMWGVQRIADGREIFLRHESSICPGRNHCLPEYEWRDAETFQLLSKSVGDDSDGRDVRGAEDGAFIAWTSPGYSIFRPNQPLRKICSDPLCNRIGIDDGGSSKYFLVSSEWVAALGGAGTLPVLDGDLHLAGLSAPVTVRRDEHGVPHIEAATQDDLFFAQGYVTAQDRLWQMDAFRRNADGDLAEILGSSLVRHDKTQRVLQFRSTAERVYANLDAADRARLDDYARGVNLFIDQHQDALPAEFRLLHYRPQPWTGVDSLSIGMMMVEMLDTHWDVKLGASRSRPICTTRSSKPIFILSARGATIRRRAKVIDLSQPHPGAAGQKTD